MAVDPTLWARATSSALDGACDYLDGQDITALPSWAAKGFACMMAAREAIDELLDELGIVDVDD
jgi:hypothetical protein